MSSTTLAGMTVANDTIGPVMSGLFTFLIIIVPVAIMVIALGTAPVVANNAERNRGVARGLLRWLFAWSLVPLIWWIEWSVGNTAVHHGAPYPLLHWIGRHTVSHGFLWALLIIMSLLTLVTFVLAFPWKWLWNVFPGCLVITLVIALQLWSPIRLLDGWHWELGGIWHVGNTGLWHLVLILFGILLVAFIVVGGFIMAATFQAFVPQRSFLRSLPLVGLWIIILFVATWLTGGFTGIGLIWDYFIHPEIIVMNY